MLYVTQSRTRLQLMNQKRMMQMLVIQTILRESLMNQRKGNTGKKNQRKRIKTNMKLNNIIYKYYLSKSFKYFNAWKGLSVV